MSGIEINRNSNPDTSITYDDTAGEFRLERDGVVQSLEIDTLSVSSNVTKDTSGDIQIRDDSSGDLFSLNDGGSPQLAAKYEGGGAFTFGRRSGPLGNKSIVLGESNEASDFNSVAIGNNVVASGDTSIAIGGGFDNITSSTAFTSVAIGLDVTASAARSIAIGDNAVASAIQSMALNAGTVSRAGGAVALGSYNEDYLGAGNEKDTINDLANDDRIFAVGAGDNPNAPVSGLGDFEYFDGRGRVDGLYVTMRNGVFARDGLSVSDNEDNNFFNSELRSRSIYYRPDLSTTGTVGSGGNVNAYAVIVRNGDGERTLLSPKNTIDVDNTALDGSNFVTIDWTGAGRERNLDGGEYVVLKDVNNTGTFEILGTTTSTMLDDTGQSTSSFTVPSRNETAVTALSVNNTQDTSGDIQIRDDSTGNLFSLDDGNSPQLAARYEGVGAFTMGVRSTKEYFGSAPSAVSGSIVIGGGGSAANDAIGANTIAIGNGVEAGFSGETLATVAAGAVGIGENIEIGSAGCVVLGSDNTVKDSIAAEDSVVLGSGNTVDDGFSFIFGSNNQVGTNRSGQSILIGDDLSIGTDSTASNTANTALYVGESHQEFENDVNVPFLVARNGSDFFVEADPVITVTNNVSLGNDSPGSLQIQNGSLVSGSIFGKEVIFDNVSVTGSHILGECTFSSTGDLINVSDIFAIDSSIQNTDGMSFSSTVAVGSEVNNLNSNNGLANASLFDSILIDTVIDETNVASFFIDSGSDNDTINVFAYSNDTIRAYAGGLSRDGSVILTGGTIDDASDSLAVNTTVSSDNTVGIGHDTYINSRLSVGTDEPNPSAIIAAQAESGQTDPTLLLENATGSSVFEVSRAGSLEFVGGITRGSRNNVSSNTSTSATDYYVGVDTSSGAYTVTLSTSDAQDGREIVIHDQAGNASSNNITIDTEGSETVNGPNIGFGNSSITIANSGDSVTLRSDGTDWYIV